MMLNEFTEDLESESSEPRTSTVSLMLTKTEHDRYLYVGQLVKKVKKKHVVPNCARKAVLRALDELEAWAKERLDSDAG